jgi:hypothetical protein
MGFLKNIPGVNFNEEYFFSSDSYFSMQAEEKCPEIYCTRLMRLISMQSLEERSWLSAEPGIITEPTNKKSRTAKPEYLIQVLVMVFKCNN